MLEFFKRLLWDESAFERYGRAILATAGLALIVNGGQIPQTKNEWLSLGAVFVSLLVGSGDKNPSIESLKKTMASVLEQKGEKTE